MQKFKLKIFLLPWAVSLVLSACTIGVLTMFFPMDKLWLPALPVFCGSCIAAAGYNVYELIVLKKK